MVGDAGQRAPDRAVGRRRGASGWALGWSLLGLVLAGVFATAGSELGAAVGLLCYGFGTGTWDVAMNVEGAEVEQMLGRSIMPRFHAGWSFGTFTGAGLGAVAAALGVPLAAHYIVLGGLAVAAAHVAVPGLPVDARREAPRRRPSPARRPGWSRGRWRSG